MVGESKLNNTFDYGSSKIHPISEEVNKRIRKEIDSESTFLKHDEIFSEALYQDEFCKIWSQPYELHSPDYNFELAIMENKYQDVMENASLEERSANLLSPKSSLAHKDFRSIFQFYEKQMSSQKDRSRGS